VSTQPEVFRVRKYPNRRFYDTTRSRHVTLDELYELVRQGHSIVVTDSNTGEDISNVVLTQMILDRDPPKLGLFPAGLLHQVIQTNQQILQSFVERYFNRALDAFLQSQQQFEDVLRRAGVPEPGLTSPIQWARSLMTGGRPQSAPRPPMESAAPEAPPSDPRPDANDSIDVLRKQLAEMSRQLESLRSEPPSGPAAGKPRRAVRKSAGRRRSRSDPPGRCGSSSSSPSRSSP